MDIGSYRVSTYFESHLHDICLHLLSLLKDVFRVYPTIVEVYKVPGDEISRNKVRAALELMASTKMLTNKNSLPQDDELTHYLSYFDEIH